MKTAKKIVVEAMIPCDVETLWSRSQEPDLHILWDIRFSDIEYLEKSDEKGFQMMDYRTKIAFGVDIKGVGRYLRNTPLKHSTFEFESDDWKSLIKIGRGIWQYKPCEEGTYFRTVYDYETNYGILGKFADAILFRPIMQFATEWSFETLRRWCSGDDSELEKRRSLLRFLPFLIRRYVGFSPRKDEAESWLGNGRETNLNPTFHEDFRRAV